MNTRALSLLAAACLALGTSACSGGSNDAGAAQPTGSSGAGVSADPAAVAMLPTAAKSKGTISVALDLQYPPTSFLSTNNEPEGFNVDIARLIAAKLGLKLEVKNVGFDSIIPGLAGGRYDFTASDMSATPERLKVLDMINYWTDGSSLAVKSGNPENLGINDSSVCGKKIAVMIGTTQQETYLPALSKTCTSGGNAAISSVVLPNVNAALTQLSSGRIDGIFYDTPSLAYAVQQHGTTFALADQQYDKPASLGTDLVALGLPKDSPLTKAVHAAMQSIIDSPEYKETLDKWGLGAGAIPTATIATASAG
ncbi:ABC transporter substrate-binding protein [Nocardioides maradonensis]